MYTLGINGTMHDTSAALVHRGRLVAFCEEERFNRVKHTTAFPEEAIRYCLREAGIGIHQVDHAGFFWRPWRGLLRRAAIIPRGILEGGKPRSDQARFFWDMFRAPIRLRRRLCFRGRFHYLDHYQAHLESILDPSGYPDPAVLIVDGVGEGKSTEWGVVEGGQYYRIGGTFFPHSLGLLYLAFTEYLGFQGHRHEAKVMGLAAYGSPRYLEPFRALVPQGPDGSFTLDPRYINFYTVESRYLTRRFIKRFGPARCSSEPIETRHQDIAASLQQLLDERVLAIAQRLRQQTGRQHLCFAGGVALNSVLNGKLEAESGFQEIYIPPWAGDQGTALGCALMLSKRFDPQYRPTPTMAFDLGPGYTEEEMEQALQQAGLKPFRTEDVAGETARRIAEGRIVGFFQGRMEIGPRALGARSLLADPRDPGMKKYLNARVKFREGFRPFAPAVLQDAAPQYFSPAGPSPHMLFVRQARPDSRARIPAVLHVDGSARLQTVSPQDSPLYHQVIQRFYQRTGVPVVLNTSFNVRGEPIVNTPAEAVACFLKTAIDSLILGPFVVDKQ